MDNIYNQQILGHAASLSRQGRLDDFDGAATVSSKICGSRVKITLKIHDGVVTDFAHDVRACALGQASSSIMAKHIIGKTTDQLKQLRDDMYAFLKEDGQPPQAPFEDFACLEPIKEFKNRHASTLLTFDGVVKAIEDAQAKE